MWFWATLIASVCWGLSYVIVELLLKKYSIPYGLILLTTSIFTFTFWVCLNFYTQKSVIEQLSKIITNYQVVGLVLLGAMSTVTALMLTYFAIGEKNAAIVTFLEISYPVFVVLFSFLLLPSFTINVFHLFGFLLIFTGAMLVSLF